MSSTLPSDLNTLTVAQLKEHLTARNLDVKGKKADLVARLEEAIKVEKTATSTTTATTTEPKPTNPPATTNTTANTAENEDDVDVTDDADNAKKTEAPSQTSNPAPSTTSASSNALSEEERKKKRAERFGTTVKPTADPESKLEQRAQKFGTNTKPKVGGVILDKAKRFGLPVRAEAKGINAGPKFAPLEVCIRSFLTKKPQQRPLGINKGNKVWSAEEEEKKRKRAERFGFNPASSVPQAKKPKTDAPATNNETQEPAKTEAAAS